MGGAGDSSVSDGELSQVVMNNPRVVSRFDGKCDGCDEPFLSEVFVVKSECYVLAAAGNVTRDGKQEHLFKVCPNCFNRAKEIMYV